MALTLHQLRKRAATFALAAAIAVMSAGCSQIETDVTQGWDADRLYEEARAAAEDSDWTRAQDYYTKLESRYPFGRYAQQAQIESAYAYWRDGDAAQCVQACDRFLRQYPNHANSDYVLYLKALATLNQRDTIFTALLTQDIYERDSDAARTAFDTFKELVERFPQSRYAHEARRRMHELVLSQAHSEYNIAKFYYDRHAYVAAIERAQNVVRTFQQTPYSDDALKLIRDCYEQLGVKDLESDVNRVIELNQNRER